MSKRPFRRRLGTLTAALAAGAIAAISISGAAVAAPPANLIDGNKTGSITVHAHAKPSTDLQLPHNGTEVSADGLTPLEGVEYSASRLDTIDLTTNAGWTELSALATEYAAAGVTDQESALKFFDSHGISAADWTGAGSQTTDANGAAVFSPLQVGAYLVSETGTPEGMEPTAPFLITVPLTDPNNSDEWLYDVHAYPKRDVAPPAVDKSVQDAPSISVGDQLTWTIDAALPDLSTLSKFSIVDNLDSRLDYVSPTRATLVDAAGNPVSGVTLTAQDYRVLVNDDADVSTTGGPVVKVEFTDQGLAKLAANRKSDAGAHQVRVTIKTTVNSVGDIQNVAVVFPNNAAPEWTPGEPTEIVPPTDPDFPDNPSNPGGVPDFPDNPGVPVTPPVMTKWGNYSFQKTDENGEALKGAQFQVFASKADAEAGTNPISFDGVSTLEVDAQGQLHLNGLRHSDYVNGKQVSPGDEGYRSYFLVEVKAPEGFELLAEPIEFVVNDASTDEIGALAVDQNVVNVTSNGGFELPLTGGAGTAAIYIAGALVVVGGIVLILRARRRPTEAHID